MQSGQVVEATVNRVEVYGIYLRHGEDTILVFVTETTWIPHEVHDCRDFASPGDVLTVKILRYVPERNEYLGSIREVEPDKNPWMDPTRFAVGTNWDGTLVRLIFDSGSIYGYMVELIPGVEGLLKIRKSRSVLRIGDVVRVVVEAVDPESQKIDLAISPKGPRV